MIMSFSWSTLSFAATGSLPCSCKSRNNPVARSAAPVYLSSQRWRTRSAVSSASCSRRHEPSSSCTVLEYEYEFVDVRQDPAQQPAPASPRPQYKSTRAVSGLPRFMRRCKSADPRPGPCMYFVSSSTVHRKFTEVTARCTWCLCRHIASKLQR